MKLKHLIVFGALLALLAVAVVVKTQQKPVELTTEEYTPLNFSLDASRVSKIEIRKGKDGKAVEIAKNESGTWVLPAFFNARADEKKIQNLFKSVPEMKGELRARDKALLADFGLTEEEAYRIGFSDAAGNTVLAMALGSKRPRYASVFIRKWDSDQVFYTETDLFGQIGIYDDPEKASPPADYWASLILAEPKAELIDELVIERLAGGKKTVVSHVRRETDPNDLSKKWWKYTRPEVPFPPDAAKIRQFFKIFETRPASKALDPQAKDYGFSTPSWQMRLHQENGEEVLVTAGAEDPAMQGIYMRVSGEPVVFLFPKYYFNHTDVDDSYFFVENPMAVDVEKTEKIFIHTPSGEVTVDLQTDKRDAVTQYLNKLKNLQVLKLSFDPAQKIDTGSGQLYWIEIKRQGVPETDLLYVEGRVLEGGREFLAAKKGGTQPFVISEASFKNLFGDVQSLRSPDEGTKS